MEILCVRVSKKLREANSNVSRNKNKSASVKSSKNSTKDCFDRNLGIVLLYVQTFYKNVFYYEEPKYDVMHQNSSLKITLTI